MLSIGIVGLPNVGKSTLFKALTNKQVDIQNYPFTTIDPNVGVVAVPDERVDALSEFSKSKKKLYTTIEFIDIAGLIKGASQGEGLGNKFLANIREVDAIAHVVRVFEDKNITHVHSTIDPVNDIEVIKTELELADLQTKEKRNEKSGQKGRDLASGGKDNPAVAGLPALELLANKKVIYVFNASESQLTAGWQPDQRLLDTIKGSDYVVLSTKLELELTELSPEDREEYIRESGLPGSRSSGIPNAAKPQPELSLPGLDALIKKGYHTLGLLTFLTTGEDESRAWTAHQGDLIPKASRAIHTDFEKLFIKAEVINWKTLIDAGSHAHAREKGLLHIVGRDYIIQEGDVVEIRI